MQTRIQVADACGGHDGLHQKASPRTKLTSTEGFSLVELLVVMAILGTLAGLAVIGIPRIMRSSQSKAVGVVIQQIAATLESYASRPSNGDYPPTLLNDDILPGVGVLSNEENCGVEALMVCLNRPGQGTRFEVEEVPWNDALTNYDDDRTGRSLTDSFGAGNKELYELSDRWGTPFAYFHHRDYDSIEVKSLGKISDVNGSGTIRCLPWKNPKTGNWFLPRSFQIISAGPDMEFNTEDDITNFER